MLKYQCLSWYGIDTVIDDGEDDAQSVYVIKNFGRDADGRSVSASITGFKPFFYVKVPEEWATNSSLHKVKSFIEEHLTSYQPVLRLFERKDFWGFTNKKLFKFFRIEFSSLAQMKGAITKLKMATSIKTLSPNIFQFKLYETNIEPYLRMIHMRKIKPSGWIQISKYTKHCDILPSTSNIDITCDWKDVSHYETADMAPFIVASFDIECTSSGGDFPVPKKTFKQLSNQIFEIWKTLQDKSQYHIVEGIINSLLYALSSDKDVECIHHVTKLKLKKPIPYDDLDMKIRDNMDEIMAIIKTKTPAELQEFFETRSWLSELEGDEIIQIGTTLHRYGEKECYYKNIITLGSCSPIDGSEVIACETERDVLLQWQKLIQDIDPDIITGYNIFGFDFSYIYGRINELKITKQFMNLGRIKNTPSEYKTQMLSSSALGDNELKYIVMHGRVLIDMMKVVQRDHKLDSYKLDAVAKHFTGQQKDDVSPKEIFALQKGCADDRAKIARYCIQDCALCNHLIIKIDIVTNNMGMSNVCLVPLEFIFMRGQGIKIYSLILNECHHEKFVIPTVKNKDSIKKETLQKIFDNKTVVDKLDAEINKKIIKACADDTRMQNSTYSNRMTSMILCAAENLNIDVDLEMIKNAYPYAKKFEVDKLNLLVKDNMNNVSETYNEDSFEGAIVLDPKQGIYIDKPVSVFDYASLYPSSMISENLSHDCIVLDEKYDNLPGLEYNEISYDIYDAKTKEKIGERKCRYVVFPDGEKGILPNILRKLLNARKLTRKKMLYKTDKSDGNFGLYNEEKQTLKNLETNEEHVVSDPDNLTDTYNEFQKAVLDGLQLAYKITANSLYGQMGAKTSQVYMKDIAACTTATGRNMILKAKEFMETNYGAEVVYGDTDSIFCVFPKIESNGHDAIMPSINIALKASEAIKPHLKAPHDLEYEKTFWPFILLSKKRYVGNLYEMDDVKYKQKSMGIVLKRRDNCNIVKHIYGGIIDIILKEQNVSKSIEFLKSSLNALINGKFELDQLVISKSLKGDYKDASKIAHKVLADRIAERDPGNKPQINDRIPYIYIKCDDAHTLQGDRIETPEYILQENLVPDYSFYITNQIMNPVIQIYSLVIDSLPGYQSQYGPNYLDKVLSGIKMDVSDTEKAMAKYETIKEVIVKELLFDPILMKIPNTKIKKSLLKKKYGNEEEANPKPKRAPRKKKDATEVAEVAEVAKGDTEDAPPPPKPKRAPRKKKDATEVAEDAPPPPKPKRAPRKKKDAEADAPPRKERKTKSQLKIEEFLSKSK